MSVYVNFIFVEKYLKTMLDTKSVPKNPGCYLFKNLYGKVLYIGKAKNLKKRVSSYFNKTQTDEKTKVLVEKIYDVEFIITNTEKESLILESNLIKNTSQNTISFLKTQNVMHTSN